MVVVLSPCSTLWPSWTQLRRALPWMAIPVVLECTTAILLLPSSHMVPNASDLNSVSNVTSHPLLWIHWHARLILSILLALRQTPCRFLVAMVITSSSLIFRPSPCLSSSISPYLLSHISPTLRSLPPSSPSSACLGSWVWVNCLHFYPRQVWPMNGNHTRKNIRRTLWSGRRGGLALVLFWEYRGAPRSPVLRWSPGGWGSPSFVGCPFLFWDPSVPFCRTTRGVPSFPFSRKASILFFLLRTPSEQACWAILCTKARLPRGVPKGPGHSRFFRRQQTAVILVSSITWI